MVEVVFTVNSMLEGESKMWWMLLILTVEGYAAHSVYPGLEQCEQNKLTDEDRCELVEVRFPQMEPMS
jgi:hypothetical protein